MDCCGAQVKNVLTQGRIVTANDSKAEFDLRGLKGEEL